jgi:hypothetical protein
VVDVTTLPTEVAKRLLKLLKPVAVRPISIKQRKNGDHASL